MIQTYCLICKCIKNTRLSYGDVIVEAALDIMRSLLFESITEYITPPDPVLL